MTSNNRLLRNSNFISGPATLLYAIGGAWGRNGIAPIVTSVLDGVLLPQPLYPRRKNPLCPPHRRLGGPQGQFGSEGSLLSLLGMEHGRPQPAVKHYSK